MPLQPFYPKPIGDRVALMELFSANIGRYTAQLTTITAAQITGQATDAMLLRKVFTYQQTAQSFAKTTTAFLQSCLTGDPAMPPVVPFIAVPDWDTDTFTLVFGIETRFLALVAQVKKDPHFTDNMGNDLHILGAAMPSPDIVGGQPVLKLAKIGPDRIRVGWVKGLFDGVQIFVDRDDTHGSVFLAVDTKPDYDDTAAWPATAKTWTYTAVYLLNDVPVGQMSAPVSINVGG